MSLGSETVINSVITFLGASKIASLDRSRGRGQISWGNEYFWNVRCLGTRTSCCYFYNARTNPILCKGKQGERQDEGTIVVGGDLIMRIPRRTASENAGALEQLYGLLYPDGRCDPINDERYRQTRSKGAALVRLWLNRSACPHAVESTSSLVHAQQFDEQLILLAEDNNGTLTLSISSVNPAAEWMVRSAYSMAIIRFVNSVVDTYQTALYAQSIFQISSRIGLPAYLVELRHAATHEDLPGLDVLRDACRDALQWLQRCFWLPTLSKRVGSSGIASLGLTKETQSNDEAQSSTDITEFQASQCRQLGHLLARYRRLAKRIVRDESLRGRYKASMLAAQAAIEQCGKKYDTTMRQVKSASQGAAGSWTPNPEEIDGSAASFFAEALLEEGGIVPLSRRKRPKKSSSTKEIVATLPSKLLQIWLPLLKHLSASTDDFADVLQLEMISRISSPSIAADASYIETVASWLMTLYGDDKAILTTAARAPERTMLYSEASEEDGEGAASDKPTLALARRLLTGGNAMSLSLVRLLCAKDEQLNVRINPLLDMAESSLFEVGPGLDQATSTDRDYTFRSTIDGTTDLERSILEMEARLNALEEEKRSTTPKCQTADTMSAHAIPPTSRNEEERMSKQEDLCRVLPGWRVAPSDWKPTPIGCLDGVVPDLYLEDSR